jgi:hypothetical protein
MGDMALAATRALAGGEDGARTTPQVYADLASRGFLSAPAWAGQAALALCAAIAFAAFWRAGAERRWRAFAAPPLALLLAAAAAAAIGFLLSLLRPGEATWFAHPEPTRAWCALLALLALVLSLWFTRTGAQPRQAGAAGAFWFAALGLAASFALPGVSILFALPALGYAIGALAALAWPPAAMLGAALAAAIAALIWAPTLYLLELALGFDVPFATALLMALMSLTWLGGLVRARGEAHWRAPAMLLAGAAFIAIVAAALVPSMTPARPRALNLTYFFDTTTGDARILAGSARRKLPRQLADAFAFAPETILPGDQQPTWAAPADVEQVAAPALTEPVVSIEGGERVLHARLAMNGAYRAVLRLPRAAEPVRATVNGVETSFADVGGEDADYLNLACQGRACDGAAIAVHFTGDGALRDWRLIGQYPGARTAPLRAAIAARPTSATPIQFGDGVLTLSPAAP